MAKIDARVPEKIAWLLSKPKRIKIAVGGRGSGKSIGVSDIMLMLCDSGERVCCTREFQNSIDDSVHETIKQEAERLGVEGLAFTNNDVKSCAGGEIFYKANNGKLKKALSLDTKVSMRITGIVNRVQVIQTFKNPDDYWTEGIYLFPLPDDSAVDNMFLRIGETIIIGEIQKKELAIKTYENRRRK